MLRVISSLLLILSAPVLADGINSFAQAKAAGVKVNADVPGDFYCGCKIRGREKKGWSIWPPAVIRCAKMKTAPAVLNGSMLSRPGNSAISVSAGRMAGGKLRQRPYLSQDGKRYAQPATRRG